MRNKFSTINVKFGKRTYSLNTLCRKMKRDRFAVFKRYRALGCPTRVHHWLFVPHSVWKKRGDDLERWEEAVKHKFPHLWAAEVEANEEASGRGGGKEDEDQSLAPGWWERKHLSTAGDNGFAKSEIVNFGATKPGSPDIPIYTGVLR
ncbi:hypothetical protein JWJ90_13295 [Desulfobulbus rhabdoformis]|uniref:hypothetical protein n=1 Tax=Desulfobulbus rhabdoformis TaxID=34032 RepID=UPI001963E1EF|nr:hypothetical protein [Desulfobulbus rhabdoformis]MBM9615255.1 hypothetical protein [Desulfobulbus rhabdoformis]